MDCALLGVVVVILVAWSCEEISLLALGVESFESWDGGGGGGALDEKCCGMQSKQEGLAMFINEWNWLEQQDQK